MIIPEKSLWQSVLITAIKDAMSSKKKNGSIYSKQIAEDAKEWLLNNNTNYFKVCSMADINPLSLREKVKEVFIYNSHNSQEKHSISNNVAGVTSNILESSDFDS